MHLRPHAAICIDTPWADREPVFVEICWHWEAESSDNYYSIMMHLDMSGKCSCSFIYFSTLALDLFGFFDPALDGVVPLATVRVLHWTRMIIIA